MCSKATSVRMVVSFQGWAASQPSPTPRTGHPRNRHHRKTFFWWGERLRPRDRAEAAGRRVDEDAEGRGAGGAVVAGDATGGDDLRVGADGVGGPAGERRIG